MIGISRFRKITCLNVILENMVYSEDTRDWELFRKAVDRCCTLKKQLESLLGTYFSCSIQNGPFNN